MTVANGSRGGARASSCRDAALAYVAQGWSVIPMEPRGKRPLVPWLEFQQHRAEDHQLREWFPAGTEANVGIVTGAVSGLVVLDIDVAHGGADSLERLRSEHGKLAPTIEAVTGSGGRHFYFAHPGGIIRNRTGLAPGIDLRGDGGCVVAPPSLHRSGRRYRWKAARAPGEVSLAVMPAWLSDLVGEDNSRTGHPLSHWRALVRDGVDEGQRNATIASLAGHLFHRGIDAQVVLELLLTWNRVRCRPPLSDHEVARVVESIGRLHQRASSGDAVAEG